MMRKTQIPWVIIASSLILAVILLVAGCIVNPIIQQSSGDFPPSSQPTSEDRTHTAEPTQVSPAFTPIATSENPAVLTSTPSPEFTVMATRHFAGLTGILNEKDGCLRLGEQTLAWPSDYRITRKGNILQVEHMMGNQPKIWEFRLGEVVTITTWEALSASDVASLQIPLGCDSRYVVFLEGPDSHLVRSDQ